MNEKEEEEDVRGEALDEDERINSFVVVVAFSILFYFVVFEICA